MPAMFTDRLALPPVLQEFGAFCHSSQDVPSGRRPFYDSPASVRFVDVHARTAAHRARHELRRFP
jgi:hypothetical protein